MSSIDVDSVSKPSLGEDCTVPASAEEVIVENESVSCDMAVPSRSPQKAPTPACTRESEAEVEAEAPVPPVVVEAQVEPEVEASRQRTQSSASSSSSGSSSGSSSESDSEDPKCDETAKLLEADCDEVEEELEADSIDTEIQDVAKPIDEPEPCMERPKSPLEEIPYIGDLVLNAGHAYNYAKTYHPQIEKSVCFVEDKGKCYYDKFAETPLAKDTVLPLVTKLLSGCLIFLTNAVNNCEDLKSHKLERSTDGSIAIVKCFLMALFLEAKREITQIDYLAAKEDLTKKATETKEELAKKAVEKKEELAKKVTEKREELKQKVTETTEEVTKKVTETEAAKKVADLAKQAADHEKVKLIQENYAKISDNVKDKYAFVKKNCTYEKMYEARDGAVNYVRQQMAAK